MKVVYSRALGTRAGARARPAAPLASGSDVERVRVQSAGRRAAVSLRPRRRRDAADRGRRSCAAAQDAGVLPRTRGRVARARARPNGSRGLVRLRVPEEPCSAGPSRSSGWQRLCSATTSQRSRRSGVYFDNVRRQRHSWPRSVDPHWRSSLAHSEQLGCWTGSSAEVAHRMQNDYWAGEQAVHRGPADPPSRHRGRGCGAGCSRSASP